LVKTFFNHPLLADPVWKNDNKKLRFFRDPVFPVSRWYNEGGMEAKTLLNDRYLLVEKLASGGMAHVWRGRDKLLSRTVAVKILREEFTRKPDFQERFLREAQAVARLSHPNLVTVYDFGMQDNCYFMVMEFVEGEDLKSFIRRTPTAERMQSLDLWLDLTIQICEGLGLAHRAGLVHCDIKPQNILLSGDFLAKLTDFGIAQAAFLGHFGEPAPEGPPANEIIWGSPQYASPEQLGGGTLTPASDVYSTGVMFYEMVTGRLPFLGKNPRTLALQHTSDPPPPPRLFNPDLPEPLEEILLRTMAKDPAQRYRNGDQLARVLKVLLAESTSLPAAAPASARQSETAVEEGSGIDWIAIGLGFLSLISIGGLIPLWVYVYFLYNPLGH
jgi:serine/threonine protein kinase